MYSVEEALGHILTVFSRLEAENVPFMTAAGRTLTEAVTAANDLPPFANSAMDGFAVHAADVRGASRENPVVLPVVADIPAGKYSDIPLLAGQAARILTGAPVPLGADLIVPIEDTAVPPAKPGQKVRLDLTVPAQVTIYKGGASGDYIRPVGEDVRAGDVVLRPGRRLRAADLGVLAGLGMAMINVVKRPLVAIISTGDELLEVDQPLEPGKIRDANSYTIAALAEQADAEVLRLGIARDTVDDVVRLFKHAVEQGANLIISTAGVSVGAYDVVKTAVEQFGALGFWRVNLRPGKPLAFGQFMGVPFIGLPGNPVSAMVTFDVFVRPALMKMSGRTINPPLAEAELAEPMSSDGRRTYARVRLERGADGRLLARSTGGQGSNILTSLVQADGLLILPEGVTKAPAGAKFSVRVFAEN